MKKALPALSVGLLSLAVLGLQAPPARKAPKPAPPPLLDGVVKGPDGKPVEKALVIARPAASGFSQEPPLTARTDASGAFRIALKSAAPHTVRIEARGLAGRTLEKVRPGSPLTVTLQKGGVIEGTVRDAAGSPVAGARVEAREDGPFGLIPSWEPGAGAVEAVADAKGRYRIEGVGAGLHTVSASGKGYGRAVKRSVAPGSRADLYLFPGASISGTVLGPDGKPLEGALVRAETEVPFRPTSRLESTDASGRFQILGLDAGVYRLVARHKDYAPGTVSGLVLEKGGDAQADVVLTAGVRLLGRLVSATERPLPGRVSVQEFDGEPASRSLAEILRAEAGEDGRFRLEGVPPGSYALAVLAPGYALKRVEVEVGTRAPEVDVGDVVLETGLAIRGSVKDRSGQPIGYAQVRGFQARAFVGGGAAEARTEADGTFVLAGLNPGSYRLTVTAPGYGAANRQVEAGAENAEFVLAPAGTITGAVVDEGGRAVESFRVTALPAQREPMMAQPPRSEAFGAGDGRFALTDVGEGSYVVQVSAPERATATVSGVKVAAGATVDVGRVRLQAGGIVRGSVVDASGAPIVGATVTLRGPGRPMIVFSTDTVLQGVSDGGGVFEVRGVPAGVVDAFATHPFFAEGRVSGLDVDPAKGPTETRIVMTTGGRLEGWVRRRDGSGIQGTQVQVSPIRSGSMVFPTGGPGLAATGPDGSFLVEHLPAGRARVTLLNREGGGRFTNVQSREVEIREGETTSVEFTSREILVSGHVTRGGEPAPNMRVTLSGRTSMVLSFAGPAEAPATPTGPQRMTALTREDGAYEMLVDEPGRFTAGVETVDGRIVYPSREVEVPDADAHLLDLAFAGLPVAGVVVDAETEQPVPQATVWASPKKEGAPRGANATAGADGRFYLELEPGEYKLRAWAEGYGGADADVSVGTVGVPELRLALARGLSISGKVVDAGGRGIGGLLVSATSPDSPTATPSGSAMTLPDGSFQVTGLAQQAYNLFVAADAAGFALRTGISPGEKEVVLTLRPGGRVRLQVRGPDEAPVAEALPYIRRLGSVRIWPMGIRPATDAQGVVELTTPAGAVEIEVVKEKLRGRVVVNVPEGATAPAEVKLQPAPATPAP